MPSPPEVVDGELKYEVSEVLNLKIARGKLLYLVDWKGYSLEERTWEPAENVAHAGEAVATYHSRYPNRPSAKEFQHPGLAGAQRVRRGVLSRVRRQPVATSGNRQQPEPYWSHMGHGEDAWTTGKLHG